MKFSLKIDDIQLDMALTYTLPITVVATTSLACNLRCRHCFNNGGPDKKDPPAENLEKLALAIPAEAKIDRVIVTGGEPLLAWQSTTTFLTRLKTRIDNESLKINTIEVNTNGTILKDGPEDRIIDRLNTLEELGVNRISTCHFTLYHAEQIFRNQFSDGSLDSLIANRRAYAQAMENYSKAIQRRLICLGIDIQTAPFKFVGVRRYKGDSNGPLANIKLKAIMGHVQEKAELVDNQGRAKKLPKPLTKSECQLRKKLRETNLHYSLHKEILPLEIFVDCFGVAQLSCVDKPLIGNVLEDGITGVFEKSLEDPFWEPVLTFYLNLTQDNMGSRPHFPECKSCSS